MDWWVLVKNNYGDWTGVIGLMLSAFAGWQAWIAAKNAKDAEKAAKEARATLRRYDATQEMRRLITDLNGLLAPHSRAAWNEVYFRYDAIREVAVRIRTTTGITNLNEQKVLDDVVTMLIDLAQSVEEAMRSKSEYPDPVPANRRIRQYAQQLEDFDVLKAIDLGD